MDYRQARLDFLRAVQNSDGGWGYFPHKKSWLEPTAYALLALHNQSDAAATHRAWNLIRSWQNPDGGWRPSAAATDSAWVTCLAVTVHAVRGVFDTSFERGVRWLLATEGAEGSWFERVINVFYRLPVEYDRRYKGWPWRNGNSSWIEPTAHSLIALKKAAPHLRPLPPEWKSRLDGAERMILDRRAVDGGWNYGNRRVYHTDLPSYPETTAVAMLGLQGSPLIDWPPTLALAERSWRDTASPLAKAWLAIALRNAGVNLPPPDRAAPPASDILLTALECLASPGGGHLLLKAEERT